MVCAWLNWKHSLRHIDSRHCVKLLQEHGCQEGQGFHFGRPITAEQFEELLRLEAINSVPQQRLERCPHRVNFSRQGNNLATEGLRSKADLQMDRLVRRVCAKLGHLQTVHLVSHRLFLISRRAQQIHFALSSRATMNFTG